MSATRSLYLDRGNEAICQITTELNAALEVDVLILSFYFDIQSLLRSITSIGWNYVFLPSSTAKSASNASDFFWLIDNRRLLREATLVGGGGDIVMLRPWFWISLRSARLFDYRRGRGVFLSAAFWYFWYFWWMNWTKRRICRSTLFVFVRFWITSQGGSVRSIESEVLKPGLTWLRYSFRWHGLILERVWYRYFRRRDDAFDKKGWKLLFYLFQSRL